MILWVQGICDNRKNKIPGGKIKEHGIVWCQSKESGRLMNELQSYESHIGNKQSAILFEYGQA